MLILIGKSASGKDKVKEILTTKYGFHSLVNYTTRPMRDGEIQDNTYHFISTEDFQQKIKSGFFAEWKVYEVHGEKWYYGTSKEAILNANKNTVVILTPDGVRDIKKYGIDVKVIYLCANLSTIQYRLKIRNDHNDKIKDRIERDRKDFIGAEQLADKIVYNNNGTDINDVIKEIIGE